MIYIDPTPHPYFKNLARVIQYHLSEQSEIATVDEVQSRTACYHKDEDYWILNYVSFKNGEHLKCGRPYIAVQTEQMDEKGTHEYRAFLKGAAYVWDWSDNFWFGYSPIYRLQMEQAKDIDVLFYGEVNTRRADVLTRTRHKAPKGSIIEVAHGAYGSDIMKYVMRSKIVLSTHYYAHPGNDMPRIAPLLSVGAFVICERTEDENFNRLTDHLVIVEKKDIPEVVAYYLERPLDRLLWADKGNSWIKTRPHCNDLKS